MPYGVARLTVPDGVSHHAEGNPDGDAIHKCSLLSNEHGLVMRAQQPR